MSQSSLPTSTNPLGLVWFQAEEAEEAEEVEVAVQLTTSFQSAWTQYLPGKRGTHIR